MNSIDDKIQFLVKNRIIVITVNHFKDEKLTLEYLCIIVK